MINKQLLQNYKYLGLIIIFCVMLCTGCSTVHVYQKGGNFPSTEWESKRVNTFLWGAIRHDVIIDNCVVGNDRINIEEIKVEKNFGSILATIVTLGLWEPVKISWKCAEVSSPDTIPVID